MKKLILPFILVAVSAIAQAATHSVTLFWTDTINPTGTTYNVYKLSGVCPTTPPTTVGTGGFTKLNTSPINAFTYQDLTVTAGSSYCYYATAGVTGTSESAPSVTFGTLVPSTFAPTGIIIVTQ